MSLYGCSLIGSKLGAAGGAVFYGSNPATGEALEPGYHTASAQDVEHAARLAATAFPIYGNLDGAAKGTFLRSIAAGIEERGTDIVVRAGLETGLPEARLRGELARTTNQLRLFAGVVEEGSWVNARIDPAAPERKPLPRADIRSMLKPLGPVAVFGASNFPLAFSVAGGDTASALAAGNPVIVKAHPAHPGTSELVGQAIRESVQACGLPEGVFSLLFDAQIEVGTQLVVHPLVKAVGFTGSPVAGKALMKLAASRPVPIPCYAEMGSVNPLFILPGAMHARSAAIASGLQNSFTLGSGQFCTKPGLVFIPEGSDGDSFTELLKTGVEVLPPQTMLARNIGEKYAAAVLERSEESGVRLAAKSAAEGSLATRQPVTLFASEVPAFLSEPSLAEEDLRANDAAGRPIPDEKRCWPPPLHWRGTSPRPSMAPRKTWSRTATLSPCLSRRSADCSSMDFQRGSRSAMRWCMAVRIRRLQMDAQLRSAPRLSFALHGPFATRIFPTLRCLLSCRMEIRSDSLGW